MLLGSPCVLAKHVHHVDHLTLYGWASVVHVRALLHVGGTSNKARIEEAGWSWLLGGSWHLGLHLGRHHHAAEVDRARSLIFLAELLSLFLLLSRGLEGSLCSVKRAADAIEQSHFIYK